MLSRTIKTAVTSAIIVGLALNVAAGGETNAIAGKWRARAFFTEDVASKVRHDVYGSHPTGAMQLSPDGHFSAFLRSEAPPSVTSTWEDVAYSLVPESARAIFYRGTYRIDGETMFVNVTNIRHEGPVGTDAFDMSWNEGLTTAEEQRSFQLVTGVNRVDQLSIETTPMPNPNGTGNIIVGRSIWERTSD